MNKKVEYKSEEDWNDSGFNINPESKPKIKDGIKLYSSKNVSLIPMFNFKNDEKNIIYPEEIINKPKPKKNVGIESDTLKTFDGWRILGYTVIAGQKAKSFNADGKALFTDSQVKYAVKSTYSNSRKTSYYYRPGPDWDDVGDHWDFTLFHD